MGSGLKWIPLLIVLSLSTGCKTGIKVLPDVNAGLPPEHVNLLQMQTDEVMQMEKQQRYAYLYDQIAAPLLRQQNPRKPFMQLTRCVETTLGPITDIHRSKLKIRFFKQHQVYQVTLPVSRQNADVTELHTFLLQPDGTLAWAGLYWQTNRKDFLDCIADIPDLNIWHPPKAAIKPMVAKTARVSDTTKQQKKTVVEHGTH